MSCNFTFAQSDGRWKITCDDTTDDKWNHRSALLEHRVCVHYHCFVAYYSRMMDDDSKILQPELDR